MAGCPDHRLRCVCGAMLPADALAPHQALCSAMPRAVSPPPPAPTPETPEPGVRHRLILRFLDDDTVEFLPETTDRSALETAFRRVVTTLVENPSEIALAVGLTPEEGRW